MVAEDVNSFQACSSLSGSAPDASRYTGMSASTSHSRVYSLNTSALSPSYTYALCYTTDSGGSFSDSGLRLRIPKVAKLIYGLPERILDPSSCFSDPVPATAGSKN